MLDRALVQRLRHRIGIGQPRQAALAVVGAAQEGLDLAHLAFRLFDLFVQHTQTGPVVGCADAQLAGGRQAQPLDAAAARQQAIAGQALTTPHQLGLGVHAAQLAELPAQERQGVGVDAVQQRGNAAGRGLLAAHIARLAGQGQFHAIDRAPAGQAAIQLDRALLIRGGNQQRLDVAAQVGFDGGLPGDIGDPHQVADRAGIDAGLAQIAHQPHGVGVQLRLAGGQSLLVLPRGQQRIACLVVGGVQLAGVLVDLLAQGFCRAQRLACAREQVFRRPRQGIAVRERRQRRVPGIPVRARGIHGARLDAAECERVELTEGVAHESDLAQQFLVQLRQAFAVAAGQFVQLRLFAIAAVPLQAGVGACLLIAQGVALGARIDQAAAGVGQGVFRGGDRAFGPFQLFAVQIPRVLGRQCAVGRGTYGLGGDAVVLPLHAFGGLDALSHLFDAVADLAEALQQGAEAGDVGGPVLGDQRAHEQVHVLHALQVERVEEGLAVGVDVGAGGRRSAQAQQQVLDEALGDGVQLGRAAGRLAAAQRHLAEGRPCQRQFLALDLFHVVGQVQRHARQQVQPVQPMVGFVHRGAQGDAGGQDFAGVGVAEHQRDVGGGGTPLASFVAAAEHAQAVVADGARAMAAAGLRVEADAAAVAAQQHDLQRIEQGALARAVGRDDGGGGVQFQGLRLEQEELHQVHALKLLHRRPP